MINRQDVKEIFYEEVENVHILLKWAWKELSWEAKKQREIFVKDFQNKVNTLSDKEKQFLVDFIEEWWAEGFDFSAKSFIEREFPEKKYQLLEIVHIISQDGIVALNEWWISLQLDIKALHDNLENELNNQKSYHELSEEKRENKEINTEEAAELVKQLNKEETVEAKENPTITEVVAKLEELLKDEKAYKHTKLIKETIGLLNKNQNLNELDDYWKPVLGYIIALSYYSLGQEALKSVLEDQSLDVNACYGYPLSLAISNQNLKAMELLLERKDLDVMAYSKDPEPGKDSLEQKIKRLGDRDTVIERVGKVETRAIKKKMMKLLKSHPSYKEN